MSLSKNIRESAHFIVAMWGIDLPDNPLGAAILFLAGNVGLALAALAFPLALLGLMGMATVGLMTLVALGCIAVWGILMVVVALRISRGKPDPWL